MKIAFTVADATAAIYAGGEVERTTEVIEIPNDWLPDNVRYYLDHLGDKNSHTSLSISRVPYSAVDIPAK